MQRVGRFVMESSKPLESNEAFCNSSEAQTCNIKLLMKPSNTDCPQEEDKQLQLFVIFQQNLFQSWILLELQSLEVQRSQDDAL